MVIYLLRKWFLVSDKIKLSLNILFDAPLYSMGYKKNVYVWLVFDIIAQPCHFSYINVYNVVLQPNISRQRVFHLYICFSLHIVVGPFKVTLGLQSKHSSSWYDYVKSVNSTSLDTQIRNLFVCCLVQNK